ncbi:hypothetical protein SAMN05518846_102213 [Brevibacillus centrosporus]|uniref:Uncharacterized protein n=1 Tax=Brevibacillus centrosporus TaxID=54910 RepID=A0A1I3NZJ8_9BACL|nr:hypothetical protein SAMN05518846_102213 [Brevibacillus centrosporus]
MLAFHSFVSFDTSFTLILYCIGVIWAGVTNWRKNDGREGRLARKSSDCNIGL